MGFETPVTWGYCLPAMLDDRPYMRTPSWESGRGVTFYLLIVTTAFFVLQSVVEYYLPSFANPPTSGINRYFALSLEGLSKGYVWQLLTYQLLHGGVWHLVFNLLAIYFFGRALEETLTRADYLRLYIGSGVCGGLMQVLFAALFPHQFGGAVVGASAGAMGLVAAFATLFPERQLTLLVLLIIPVSMLAKTLLYISLAIAVFGLLIPTGNIANAAHLGGLLAGIAYIRWAVQSDFLADSLRALRPKPRPRPRELVSTEARKPSAWPVTKPAAKPTADHLDLPAGEFISREVDPILDKISAHGLQSLTERERKILELARAKMGKR